MPGMWSALRLFALVALVTVISLNIAGSPRKPRLSPSPQRVKKTNKQFSNKSMVLERLKLRLFITRRQNMNEKRAITGPADGEPRQDAQ